MYKTAHINGRQVLLKRISRAGGKVSGEPMTDPAFLGLKGFALSGYMVEGETIEECLSRRESERAERMKAARKRKPKSSTTDGNT